MKGRACALPLAAVGVVAVIALECPVACAPRRLEGALVYPSPRAALADVIEPINLGGLSVIGVVVVAVADLLFIHV